MQHDGVARKGALGWTWSLLCKATKGLSQQSSYSTGQMCYGVWAKRLEVANLLELTPVEPDRWEHGSSFELLHWALDTAVHHHPWWARGLAQRRLCLTAADLSITSTDPKFWRLKRLLQFIAMWAGYASHSNLPTGSPLGACANVHRHSYANAPFEASFCCSVLGLLSPELPALQNSFSRWQSGSAFSLQFHISWNGLGRRPQRSNPPLIRRDTSH